MKFLKFEVSIVGTATGIISLIGCLPTQNPVSPSKSGSISEPSDNQAFYFRNIRGPANPGFLYGTPIHYEEVDGDAVFQGDILLSKRQLNTGLGKSAASGRPTSYERWPGNTVPYALDTLLPAVQQDWILENIHTLSGTTPIKFVRRTTESDYVYFQESVNSCSSPVGRQGLMQPINLAPWCNAGAIYHEILHALGMWHEQSRADRDEYVTVNYANIKDEYSYRMNWEKYWFNNGFDFGTFDFNSIMLYGSGGGIDPAVPVMTRKDGSTWEGNLVFPSEGDLHAIAAMYPSEVVAPFKARDIGVGADGSVYKVSNAKAPDSGEYLIYRFDEFSWQWLPLPGAGGVRIDVGPDGKPWIVQSTGKILRYDGAAWIEPAGALKGAVDIGIGADGSVFALSSQVMDSADFTVWEWTGSAWNKVESGKGLRISVDDQGFPWTVNAAGDIARWTDRKWETMSLNSDKALDIGIGKDGSVYAVGGEQYGSDFQLYRKAGTASDNRQGHATFFCVGSVSGLNVDAHDKSTAWLAKADLSTHFIAQ